MSVNIFIFSGLQSKVTPIIAGLLENDTRLKYSFDDFFRRVKDLVSLKYLAIFSIPAFTHLRVYAHAAAR